MKNILILCLYLLTSFPALSEEITLECKAYSCEGEDFEKFAQEEHRKYQELFKSDKSPERDNYLDNNYCKKFVKEQKKKRAEQEAYYKETLQNQSLWRDIKSIICSKMKIFCSEYNSDYILLPDTHYVRFYQNKNDDFLRWDGGLYNESANLLISSENIFYSLNLISINKDEFPNYSYLYIDPDEISFNAIPEISDKVVKTCIEKFRNNHPSFNFTSGFLWDLNEYFICDNKKDKKSKNLCYRSETLRNFIVAYPQCKNMLGVPVYSFNIDRKYGNYEIKRTDGIKGRRTIALGKCKKIKRKF